MRPIQCAALGISFSLQSYARLQVLGRRETLVVLQSVSLQQTQCPRGYFFCDSANPAGKNRAPRRPSIAKGFFFLTAHAHIRHRFLKTFPIFLALTLSSSLWGLKRVDTRRGSTNDWPMSTDGDLPLCVNFSRRSNLQNRRGS